MKSITTPNRLIEKNYLYFSKDRMHSMAILILLNLKGLPIYLNWPPLNYCFGTTFICCFTKNNGASNNQHTIPFYVSDTSFHSKNCFYLKSIFR